MPKTKFQNFIFTFMTVILMAYCMIVYNIAINSSDGLMSIYALFTQHLINSNVICNYIVLYCKNFIMAYPLQIFLLYHL